MFTLRAESSPTLNKRPKRLPPTGVFALIGSSYGGGRKSWRTGGRSSRTQTFLALIIAVGPPATRSVLQGLGIRVQTLVVGHQDWG